MWLLSRSRLSKDRTRFFIGGFVCEHSDDEYRFYWFRFSDSVSKDRYTCQQKVRSKVEIGLWMSKNKRSRRWMVAWHTTFYKLWEFTWRLWSLNQIDQSFSLLFFKLVIFWFCLLEHFCIIKRWESNMFSLFLLGVYFIEEVHVGESREYWGWNRLMGTM